MLLTIALQRDHESVFFFCELRVLVVNILSIPHFHPYSSAENSFGIDTSPPGVFDFPLCAVAAWRENEIFDLLLFYYSTPIPIPTPTERERK